MKALQFPATRLYLIAAIFVSLTACNSSAPLQSSTQATPRIPILSTAMSGKETLDLNTPWSPGAELNALIALEAVFRRRNPNYEVANNRNGGGGGGTDEYLQQSFRQEQPPDAMVIHAGKESLDYINRGELEPITRIFREEGLDKVMPRLLLEQLTIKGEIYTVPVNIQRSNLLWYNPKVFQANNVKPPRTLDEFFVVAEKLKQKGITPFATGGSFELGQLFETVLVATYGPDDYLRLMNGDAALWADARLTTAIHSFRKMLGYSNSDRSTTGWDVAAQRVLEGKAGMTITGDWTEGMYKTEDAKPNKDFGWIPSPGTDGTFMWLSDSFGLPKGAPHREAAIEFLRTVGSKEGQDAFNPIKGSIPARIDADASLYDEYLQWSIQQFRTNNPVPSIMHGAAAPDAFRSVFARAAIDFSNDGDEQRFAEALRNAAIGLEP